MTQEQKNLREHPQRDDLTGEHGSGDAGQLIFAILFVVIWFGDTFFLQYTTFLNHYMPLYIRIPLAVVLLGLAAYLSRTGMAIVFGERRAVPCVIRKSVFSVIRHPMYFSEVLLYLGLLLLSLSLAAALVCCFAVVFLYYISRWEEKKLLARFGEEYAQYMRDVPMWIPRLRKR